MTTASPDLAAFRALLGPKGWRDGRDVLTAHGTDWLGRAGATPLGVALPESTEQAAALVWLCAQQGISITPQGGNTGLNGASILSPGASGIILSMARLNRIRSIDPTGLTAVVEAGMVLSRLHDALEEHGLMLPLHLGSGGSAQIGGLIGTNAGGSHAMRYGMMEAQVLGLEVVLPDGSVWNGLRSLIKDNSGYALRRLFCGAEGTLGVVTCASLRLQPAPRSRATALLAVDGMEEALELHSVMQRGASELLASIEFFCERGLSLLLKHFPSLKRPFMEPWPFYVLVELQTSTSSVDIGALLESVLEACFGRGLLRDGLVAASETQRAEFWKLREELPEGQRREGPQLKHDVAVPVRRLAEFIKRAEQDAQRILAGVRIVPFGHLGDGNVHLNLSPPRGSSDFNGRGLALADAIYRIAVDMGGTFSAEHGLGTSKVALADSLRDPTERKLMLNIKQAIDPNAIMNPGKLLAWTGNGKE